MRTLPQQIGAAIVALQAHVRVKEEYRRARGFDVAGDERRVEIEMLDMTDTGQIESLGQRLASRQFDLLFVNAGVAIDPNITMGAASLEDFIHVMVTNCLSPMRVIEKIGSLVAPRGTIAVMSSILGSVGANNVGTWEVYRGSKAALPSIASTARCAVSS